MSDNRTEKYKADMQAMVARGAEQYGAAGMPPVQRSDTFLTFVSIEERAQDPSDETATIVAAEQDIIDNVLGEAIGYPTIAELHVAGTSARLAALASHIEPRDIAAYLLDRAAQYTVESGLQGLLTTFAVDIIGGPVQNAKDRGELDAALYDRVDRMAQA